MNETVPEVARVLSLHSVYRRCTRTKASEKYQQRSPYVLDIIKPRERKKEKGRKTGTETEKKERKGHKGTSPWHVQDASAALLLRLPVGASPPDASSRASVAERPSASGAKGCIAGPKTCVLRR